MLALFAISEPLMGQVVEPMVFGHSTGLSPIAVIGAAAFWTWLWGSIGLLLAMPLTVCLVVLGRHVEQLEFLEVMLGDQPPLDPEELFYQRALSGDVDAMADQAEACLRAQRLPDYLDGVALPALALAQADAAHGTLTPERQERMERSVVTLLEDLEEADEATAAKAERRAAAGKEALPEAEGSDAAAALQAPVPAPWQEPGAVLCLPGRGPFDALLATMVGQALARRGFGVQVGGQGTTPGAPPRLLCLCLVEGGASAAAARYLLRRARRQHAGRAGLGAGLGHGGGRRGSRRPGSGGADAAGAARAEDRGSRGPRRGHGVQRRGGGGRGGFRAVAGRRAGRRAARPEALGRQRPRRRRAPPAASDALELSPPAGRSSAMTLPSAGKAPRGTISTAPRRRVTACRLSARAAGRSDGASGGASARSVIASCSPSRVTTRRRRPSSGWRRAMAATCSGRTNMPRTLAVWSARPRQPRMRVLVRPQGDGPGMTPDRSPSAMRRMGCCGSSVVTTTSPISPSGTGSPVPGRTISTTMSSFTTSPRGRSVS